MVAVMDETEDRERAFVFSCLTGLRFSDVKRLKWGQVISFGNFTRIEFTQKKTNGVEYIDISSQAVKFMGDRGSDDECVFKLKGKSYSYFDLKSWLDRAGINKHVSFHSARHSFAVMLLDLGTDIYTVSKFWGIENSPPHKFMRRSSTRINRRQWSLFRTCSGDCVSVFYFEVFQNLFVIVLSGEAGVC